MRRRYLRHITLLMNMLCLLPMMAVDITIRTDEASPVRFVYGCQVFTHSGTYTNVEYEGELRTLNLRFECNKSYSSLSQTIELGQDALFGCKVIHPEVAGVSTYYDTLVNSKGCDSIVTLTLTVVEPPACEDVHYAFEDSIYEGEKYLFGCKVLTEAGEYNDTLSGAAVTGCDSIVTLTLSYKTPLPPCEDVLYAFEDSVYEGEKYLFGCKVLTEAGEYNDTLSGAAVTGCDSIVTLTLSYKTPLPLCEDVYYAYEDSIYEGEKYLFGCKVLTEAGEYKDTLLNGSANGCDSIVTLTLKIMTIVYDSVRQAHCGEVAETFCKGTSITTVSGKELTVNGALVFNDTVLNFRPMETDEVNHKHIYHDTIVSYQLNVWPLAENAFEDSIYEGEKYLFGCRVIDTAGIYVDTLINGSANGCDSIVTLTLNIMPPLYDSIRQPHYGEVIETLCKGTILTTVSGNKLTVNGAMEFNDTLLNFIPMETDEVNRRHIYHDTIVAYQLDVWDEARGYMEDSIYFNETYLFHCEQLTDTGTYTHTLPGQSMHGCDSIITLHLTLRTHYDSIRIYNEGEQYDTICLGETYTSVSGKHTTISGETAFSDTLSDYKEMLVDDENHIRIYYDTVVSYHISVWETAEGFATDSIYEGETYLFHCEQLTDSGTYTHVLPKQSIHGCDSTITLHLTFRTKYDSIRIYHPGDTIVTVCPGTIYTIGGKDYAVTEGLEVTDTIADFIDMETDDIHHQYIYHDSLLTYHFSLWETARGYMEDSIYFNETYLFHCEQLTDTGTYTHTLPGQSIHGCDSTITLHLTLRTYYDSVRVYVTGEQYDTVCVGEEYISIGGKLTTINGETAFSDTLTDYLDMYPDDENHHRVYTDSVVTYHISVWQPTESSIEDSIYAGQTYLFHGEQLTDTGIYVHTLRGQNMRGCDSIVTLHLKMWTPVYETLYEYHTAELYDTVCPGAPFMAYSSKEYEIKAAQTIYDTVADYLPMQVDEYQFTYTYHDTVNIYHLSLWTPGDSLITDSIYEGESYPFRGRQLTDAGTYRDTLRGADMHECDSIVTLILSYRTVYESEKAYDQYYVSATLCPGEPYQIGNSVYTVDSAMEIIDTVANYKVYINEEYKRVFRDSVTTFHLYVWIPGDSTIIANITEGESYPFGGKQLTEADTYHDTIVGGDIHGCDSIVTLILTVTQLEPEPIECDSIPYTFSDTIYEGEKYLFGCLVRDTAGVYCDTLLKANGCDSIVILTLTYKPKPEPEPEPVVCDSVPYEFSDSIYLGEKYLFGCQVRDTAGVYVDTLLKANGCDSIVILTLTYKQPEPLTPPEIEPCDTVWHPFADSIAEGEKYLFGCQMLDTIGTFTDTLHNAAANGCDSIVILTLTYKQPEPIVIYDSVRTYVYGEIYDTVCLGNTYMIADRIYTVEAEMAVSDTLTDYLPMRVDEELHQHIYTDSVTTYYLSVWLPSDSTVQDSIILGDSYVFGTDTITPSELGELIRYDTLPNAHGCDSIVTLELKILEVFTIREYVYAAKQDTLCKGDSYTYGEHSLTLSGDTVVSDTVVAVRVVEDEEQHTVTYTDSVTTHTLYVWHNELNINIGELNWGYAFCGTPYSGDTAVLQTLREAIEADELFQSDTTIRVLYKDSTSNYVPYTGSEIAATMDELSLRIEVSNACGILRYDTTLVIAQPDYEKGVEFTDMPAVSKYNDWLLMVDLDSLNNYYGLYPEPDSVRWYRIVGDEIDISADELVGTGYYYTDDRHLVGKYYAIISMPETRDECGGTWSTRVLVHSPANAPLLLAPNIGKPGKPMSLYNLIADLPTTLSIYNAEGIQLLTWTHTSDGTKAAAVPTQGLQSGVYLLYVSNAEQREAIRFIIRQ